MKKNIKLSFVIVFIQITLLLIEPFAVYAGLFGSGNVSGQVRSGINDFLEEDLNINVEDALKPITETINSTDRKGKIPEVSIRFSTTNPKPGEIVTASADVKNISNVKDAYYMWYLTSPKRMEDEALAYVFGLEPGGHVGDAPTHHILAVQAQAALYFDPLMLDQKMNGGNEDNSYIDDYERVTTDDDDGYKVPLGGANASNAGGEDYCYIYDPEDGTQYELMLSDGEDAETGDGCDDYDTDTIDYVARCMIGDKANSCPTKIVSVEGIFSSETTEEDEETNTSTSVDIGGGGGARSRNLARCLDYGVKPKCSDEKLSCPSADGSTVTEYKLDDPSVKTPEPYCIPKDRTTGQLWVDPYTSGCPEAVYSFCFSGEPWPDAVTYEAACGATYGEERPNYYGAGGCHDHLAKGTFQEPGECTSGELENDDDNACPAGVSHQEGGIRPFPGGSGDGDFPVMQELLYHLNPLTSRTTPLALNDEALTMGVGMIDFTWKYEEGDKLGVVVEGMGAESTKHEDATYQIVYAMMQPGCKDVIEPIGSYNETIKEKSINILTASANIGKCISGEESGTPLYMSPGTSEYDALNVSVSTGASQSGASVASGIDYPMHITATAGQSQGGAISPSQKLYYEWSVTCGDTDITEDLGISTTQGMNMPTLDFKANFPETCFSGGKQAEIKVTTKVNEPRSGGGSNFGQTTTTFTAFNAEDNPLEVYKTQTSGTQFTATGENICDEGIDRTICRVMNNEIIALTAPNIEDGMVSWQVNGQSYKCDSKISADCVNGEKAATNTIIVPMTGNDGDTITITANTNTVDKETNQAAQLMRTFRITEPEVTIEPVSGAQKKVLGSYRWFHNTTISDESSKVFTTQEGQTVELIANLYPGFLNQQDDAATYEWTLNGEVYSTDKSIQFVPDGQTTVGVVAKRAQSLDDRLILEETLGITQKESIPTTFSASVQINIEEESLAQNKGVTGFFASVSQNTPFYLLFVLKMALIMSIMLFVPSLILSVGKNH